MPPRYANGHISATGYPIHFMFSSRVGFQGRWIEWRYFRLQIQVAGRLPSWIISIGHISATTHSIHLYNEHRAVIFAIAQLSCFITRPYTKLCRAQNRYSNSMFVRPVCHAPILRQNG